MAFFPGAVFMGRFAIPLLISCFYMINNPGIVEFYDSALVFSDWIRTSAKAEGEGNEVFDYIIVGAGSAGAVLANRLTADGLTRVLLLEAGGDPNILSELPHVQTFILQNSTMNYGYSTVQETKACLYYVNGFCGMHRGKALGGSSSVNGMVYNRANPKDFDRWASYLNDPKWAFSSILDAYKKLEDYHGFYEENPGPNHGIGGDVYVGRIEYLPTLDVLYEAAEELGIPIGDLNSGLFPTGFSPIDYNIKDGLRVGTYQAFLEPILNRTNLVIYRYATVTKINMDGLGVRALGVTYSRHERTQSATATKEVIISAGVVESPKLLMLSGFGPRSHLESLGIPVLSDLPAVGSHLQEHPGVERVPFYINRTYGQPYLTVGTVEEFIQNQTGPLTSLLYGTDTIAPQIAMGYISSQTNADLTWPDLKIYIHEEMLNDVDDSLFYAVEMTKTDTLGSIRLSSADPDDSPIIHYNFFDVDSDIDRMVDGIEFMNNMFMNTTAYQRIGTRFMELATNHPGCGHETFPSRAYWRCYVMQMALPFMHPTSTCRMAPNSTVGVVDTNMRVFGTSNLRVIDSSAMPFIPNGNTHFPSMMLGEMGARIILGTLSTL